MARPELEYKTLSFNELQEIDDIVKTELDSHPEIKNTANKIAHIWAIFSEELDELKLSQILGVSAKDKDGLMYGLIPENLSERMDRTFAYASILERETKDPKEISKILKTPLSSLKKDLANPSLPNRSPFECMVNGEIDIVLLRAGIDFKDSHIWE